MFQKSQVGQVLQGQGHALAHDRRRVGHRPVAPRRLLVDPLERLRQDQPLRRGGLMGEGLAPGLRPVEARLADRLPVVVPQLGEPLRRPPLDRPRPGRRLRDAPRLRRRRFHPSPSP